jgi:hypothetical protein
MVFVARHITDYIRLHEMHLLPCALSSFELCKCVDTHEHIDDTHIFLSRFTFTISKKTADCLISNKLLNLDVTWCHNCNSESLCRAVARATSFAWDQLWTQLAMDAGVDQPGLWMRLSIYWKNGFVWEFGTSKSKRISSVSPLKWHFLEFTYIPFWPHAMCKQCSVGQLAQLAALFQVSFMPALQLPRP